MHPCCWKWKFREKMKVVVSGSSKERKSQGPLRTLPRAKVLRVPGMHRDAESQMLQSETESIDFKSETRWRPHKIFLRPRQDWDPWFRVRDRDIQDRDQDILQDVTYKYIMCGYNDDDRVNLWTCICEQLKQMSVLILRNSLTAIFNSQIGQLSLMTKAK